MEETVDYKYVYELQDQILEIVRTVETPFYLTGGTALHRFYYHLRYSDDLDFFVTQDLLFSEYVREILEYCRSRGYEYSHLVQSKNFHRILFRGILQVDFVHDSVFRFGKSVLINGNKVDNVLNILANKVAALMDRDEEKDVFDLFAIAAHESFEWGHILDIANRKAIVDRAFFVERLKSFPLSWLERLKYIRPFPITREMVDQMVRDILRNGANTLCKEVT